MKIFLYILSVVFILVGMGMWLNAAYMEPTSAVHQILVAVCEIKVILMFGVGLFMMSAAAVIGTIQARIPLPVVETVPVEVKPRLDYDPSIK